MVPPFKAIQWLINGHKRNKQVSCSEDFMMQFGPFHQREKGSKGIKMSRRTKWQGHVSKRDVCLRIMFSDDRGLRDVFLYCPFDRQELPQRRAGPFNSSFVQHLMQNEAIRIYLVSVHCKDAKHWSSTRFINWLSVCARILIYCIPVCEKAAESQADPMMMGLMLEHCIRLSEDQNFLEVKWSKNSAFWVFMKIVLSRIQWILNTYSWWCILQNRLMELIAWNLYFYNVFFFSVNSKNLLWT